VQYHWRIGCGQARPEQRLRVGTESAGACWQRFHPPDRTRMQRHRRAHLESADLTAVSTPHRERQTQRAATLCDQIGERQHGPSIARVAVGVQLVPMFVQARNAAEVDHRASVDVSRLTA
jgi:hypothetical protein